MRLSSRFRVVMVCLSLLSGCEDEPDPPPVATPTLSETPLWQVKADPTLTNECFGSSVGLADFNGDGLKDLVVGTEPCQTRFLPAQHPGRVSFFAGQQTLFSTQAVSALMTWQNTHPRTSGDRLRVEACDVNGDAFADLLVTSRYGATVFLGQADLGAMLASPYFRVPGNGLFRSIMSADVNGDGRDDLVTADFTGAQRFYLSTPGAEGGPYTLVQTRNGSFCLRSVGDLNADGADDLLCTVAGTEATGLYLGCKVGSPFACDGQLSAEPLWTVDFASILALHPDLNGDGRPEFFLAAFNGPTMFHLSGPGGAPSRTPVWTLQGDPTFPILGDSVQALGDVDGDGRGNDFVMTASGRVYFFSAGADASASLRPVWAWPRSDSLPNGYVSYRNFTALPAGDVNGDGFDDLVLANTAYGNILEVPVGDVAVYTGGQVPAEPAEPPFIKVPAPCGLALDPVNGKPDLTVDRDTLVRTVHVAWKNFADDSCEVQERCVDAGGRRKLLRFSTSIPNLGSAAAIFPPVEERPDIYTFDACHGHDHLTHFAGYELLDATGKTVMTARKQGFALVDIESYCSDATQWTYYEPMGISPGWADIYTIDVPCQWLDITDLADGTYTFQVSVNNSRIVEEGTVHPNKVSLTVKVEGDTATYVP